MSYLKLRTSEVKEMNSNKITDEIAYALNCLTECTHHKFHWGCQAIVPNLTDVIVFDELNISPGAMMKIE